MNTLASNGPSEEPVATSSVCSYRAPLNWNSCPFVATLRTVLIAKFPEKSHFLAYMTVLSETERRGKEEKVLPCLIFPIPLFGNLHKSFGKISREKLCHSQKGTSLPSPTLPPPPPPRSCHRWLWKLSWFCPIFPFILSFVVASLFRWREVCALTIRGIPTIQLSWV